MLATQDSHGTFSHSHPLGYVVDIHCSHPGKYQEAATIVVVEIICSISDLYEDRALPVRH